MSSHLCILTCLSFHPLLLMVRPSQPMPPPVQTGYRRRLVGPSRLSPDPHDCAFFGPKGAAVLAGRSVHPFSKARPCRYTGGYYPCLCVLSPSKSLPRHAICIHPCASFDSLSAPCLPCHPCFKYQRRQRRRPPVPLGRGDRRPAAAALGRPLRPALRGAAPAPAPRSHLRPRRRR